MIFCLCEFKKTSWWRHSILRAICFLHNRQEVETVQKEVMGNISWRTNPQWSASPISAPPPEFPEQPKLRPPPFATTTLHQDHHLLTKQKALYSFRPYHQPEKFTNKISTSVNSLSKQIWAGLWLFCDIWPQTSGSQPA